MGLYCTLMQFVVPILTIKLMVQILQITLKQARFKSKTSSTAKALVKIFFGQAEKSFPNPRMIKNDGCIFYGQRLSLSSNEAEPIDRAYVNITVLDGPKGTNQGDVEIDIRKVKEHKDGSKVLLELQNDNYYLNLEALFSSYGGPSEGDNRSQKSETLLSPLRPNSNAAIGAKVKSSQSESSYTPVEKVSTSSIEREHRTEIKRDADKVASKPLQFSKKTSLNNLSQKPTDDDRKSEISEKPSRRVIQRNKEEKETRESREPSVSQSIKQYGLANQGAYKKTKKFEDVKAQQEVLTPPASVRNARREVRTKKEQQQESAFRSLLNQFTSKDYIQFAAVSAVSFVVGMVVKKF